MEKRYYLIKYFSNRDTQGIWRGSAWNSIRQHIKNIAAILDEALEEAKITLDDIDYIAVTYAPG